MLPHGVVTEACALPRPVVTNARPCPQHACALTMSAPWPQVSATEEGLLRSTSPVHGRFYLLGLVGARLVVREEHPRTGTCLELLDAREGCLAAEGCNDIDSDRQGPGRGEQLGSSSGALASDPARPRVGSSLGSAVRAPVKGGSVCSEGGSRGRGGRGGVLAREKGGGRGHTGVHEGFGGDGWATQLPARLRECYSHWLCRYVCPVLFVFVCAWCVFVVVPYPVCARTCVWFVKGCAPGKRLQVCAR